MYAWHVHHQTLYEAITGAGIAGWQQYIKEEKPPKERPRRLRLLKLVKNQDLLSALILARNAAYPDMALSQAVRKVITALHNAECKRCPWNGKTIFPRRIK